MTPVNIRTQTSDRERPAASGKWKGGKSVLSCETDTKTIFGGSKPQHTGGGMTSLCYPYGSGITCVCDEPGRIYKCFPDIKSDSSHGSNSDHRLRSSSGSGSSNGVMVGANTLHSAELHRKLGSDSDSFDRRFVLMWKRRKAFGHIFFNRSVFEM